MSSTYNNIGPIYITQSNYDALVTAGTIEEGREYVIVDADAPVTDVQVNGTSVTSSGVANIPLASDGVLGAVATSNKGIVTSSGDLRTVPATYIALNNGAGNYMYHPVCASAIGLATKKALGVTLDSSTSNTTWTPTEQATARNTLGAITIEEYDSTATPEENVLYYVVES